jgi:Amt family ammonium transporter
MKGKLTLSTLRWVRWVVIPALVVVLLVAATPAFAADEDPVANIGRGLNTVWVLVAAFLVFFMQAGFAFVEAGMTRSKNTVNILFKNTIDFVVATLAFWAIGYALMFGTDAGGLIGTSGFALDPTTAAGQEDVAGLPVMAFWFFQLVFAGTAATIVSGAMAERTKFIAYLGYSFLISAFIYPIAAHWIWGGGWLSSLGTTTTITGGTSFRDFAGSTVVHSIGGWIALLGAIALGPRLGRFTKDGKAKAIPGHSIALVVLGVFILWFGWFGFNPGSQLAADGANADVIALVAANTNLAAAAGGLAAMLLAWYFVKKPDLGSTLNGVLAGLVAVTAPCAFISPVSAVIIGAVGGVIVVLGVMLLERVKVDDPVSAVPVHLLNGIWGTLAVGLFATDTGLLTTGQAGQLIAQIIGIVAVGTWCVVMGSVMFFLLKKTVGLRVSREEELAGLDYHEHGSAAYPADVQGELVGTTAHVGAAAGGK